MEQSGVGELQLGNFTVTPDHTVYGEVYNYTGATKNVILKVTFYGAGGRILGTGTGGVSALAAEQLKTFTLTTLDDVSGYQNFKLDVDSAL